MLQDACSSPSPGQLIPPPPPVYTSVDGDNTGRAVWAPCTVRCEHPVHELRSCFFGSDKSTSFSWGAPCGPGDILCRCWVVAFSNFRWANLGTSLWTLRLRPHLSSIGNGQLCSLRRCDTGFGGWTTTADCGWRGGARQGTGNCWHPVSLEARDPQERVLSGWPHRTEQKLLLLNLVINPQSLCFFFFFFSCSVISNSLRPHGL